MSGHVFISYANSDLEVAERVCEGLEHRGTKCWIAPRDVTPGKTYASEIVRAIRDASREKFQGHRGTTICPEVAKHCATTR